MNQLSMVGFTHRGAALPLLEKVSVPRGERGRLLAELRQAGHPEAVILSTCSRTEIYAATAAGDPLRMLDVLNAHAGRSAGGLRAAAEIRTGHAVIEHLFRVTSGLESRVIGEVEIHGQVRSAFREAQAAGMTGSLLGQLLPAALRCGSRVRAATPLGGLGRSLGHQAVDLGLAALGDVVDPLIVVVGSGRMAASAVAHLQRLGRRPMVAARNEAHAARLAGADLVCPLPALAAGVQRADLLICATSAAHNVVTLIDVRQAMAARLRPLTVVDLSVPRNVDSAVAAVPGVRLIDLEGMNDDVAMAPELAVALEAGAEIVRAEARRYADGISARGIGPVIAALRRRVEEDCCQELVREAGPWGVDEADLARAARAAAGRLLHRPTITARAAVAAGDTDALLTLCATFGVRPSDLCPASPDSSQSQLRSADSGIDASELVA